MIEEVGSLKQLTCGNMQCTGQGRWNWNGQWAKLEASGGCLAIASCTSHIDSGMQKAISEV